jgi:hypothetical protein
MSLGGTNILGLILDLTDNATPKLRAFGSALGVAGRQVDSFASGFAGMETASQRAMTSARNSADEMKNIMQRRMADPVASWNTLDRAAATQMDRSRARYNAFMDNLHQTSQRYQSAIMGSVAISMTGVGIQNYARPILEGWEKMTKAAMDYQQSLVKIQLTTADFGGLKGPALTNANKQITNSIMAAGIASPLSNTQMADMTQTLATMGYHKSGQLNSLIAPSMLLQAISQKSDGSFELDQNSAAQLVSSLVLQSGKGLGKYKNTSLAGQKFSGVSENAMNIVSQMTKAAHDAHLTYADIKSYVGSGGATMGMSHMSLADFLTFGGALKKTGINPRQAGQDVKGLVQSASKFEAQNAMKPPKANSLGWWAEKLGFTSSNLSHNGDYLNNLLGVIDKAKKSGNLDKLMYSSQWYWSGYYKRYYGPSKPTR